MVVYVVGLIFIGGMTFADNKSQDDKIEEHSDKLAEDDVREQKDAIERERIKINQEYLRQEVGEIKQDVKDNADKLDEILEAIRD